MCAVGMKKTMGQGNKNDQRSQTESLQVKTKEARIP